MLTQSLVTHIKHPPPKTTTKKTSKTELLLTPGTPIVSAIKHTNKLLANLPKVSPKARYVSLRALGKAIDRALIVAVQLQSQGKTVTFHTGTVTVVDEFESTVDPNEDAILKPRKVSSIEIRVYL
jgi:DNA-binding protein